MDNKVIDRIIGFAAGVLLFSALSATVVYINHHAPPINYNGKSENYHIQDLNNNGIPEEFYLETSLDGKVDTVFKSIDGREVKNYLNR